MAQASDVATPQASQFIRFMLQRYRRQGTFCNKVANNLSKLEKSWLSGYPGVTLQAVFNSANRL